MLSSDPKLPQLSEFEAKDGNVPVGFYRRFQERFYTLWRELARNDNDVRSVIADVPSRFDFRLTLESGVPVSTTDQTAKETLYLTPYTGNEMALYAQGRWRSVSSAELSIDVPDVTGVHDVFVYLTNGAPTLEVLAWTNNTTRATALTTQDGVLVKSGDAARRYVGTFYGTTAGNGQIEDSKANRYLWNYYNRVLRPMHASLQGSAGYSYDTQTLRQTNNNTGNQLNMVIGVSEDVVWAKIVGNVLSVSYSGVIFDVSFGLDSTNTADADSLNGYRSTGYQNTYTQFELVFSRPIAAGKRYLAWLEAAGETGKGLLWNFQSSYSQKTGMTGFICC